MKDKAASIAILLSCGLLLFGCPQNKINKESANSSNSTEESDITLGSNVDLKKLTNALNIVVAGDGTKPAEAGSRSSVGDGPSDIPLTRSKLSDLRTVVKVLDGKKSAGVSVPGFGGITLGQDEKSLSVYYIETKSVIRSADTAVYGIGYSVHYLFKKVKRGVGVDKLPVVAASVQLDGNKTQVYYSLQTYGIAGAPLVKHFRPVINKPFDVEGFGIMQSSIDGIHNVLSDSLLAAHVRFKPQHFRNIKASDL